MHRVSGWIMPVFRVYQLSLLCWWAERGRSLRKELPGDPSEVSDLETERGIDWKKTGVKQINSKEK